MKLDLDLIRSLRNKFQSYFTDEYEIRWLTKDRKVKKVEIRNINPLSEPEPEGELSPLVSSNPMSEKEIWNEPTFTLDEKRIKTLKRIVIDIDYPYEEVELPIRAILGRGYDILEHVVMYKSVSDKMHIHIAVRDEGRTVEAIKIAKVFLHKFNEDLKEYGYEIDTTFLHNLGHYIFTEEVPIPIKGNKKSQLMYNSPIEVSAFNIFAWREFLKEYDDYFQEKKERKKQAKERKKTNDIEYKIQNYLEEHIKLFHQREKLGILSAEYIDRSKSKRNARIGMYFKNVVQIDVDELDLSSIKQSFVYRYLLDKHKNEDVALIKYLKTMPKYLKEALHSIVYYKTTYEGNSKSEYRYKHIIYPTVQLLVDTLGYENAVKYAKVVIDVFYGIEGNLNKPDLVDDIIIAYRYSDRDNVARLTDKNFIKYFGSKNRDFELLVYDFLSYLKNNEIKFLRKKDIKQMYNLSDKDFSKFKKLLEYLEFMGFIKYEETSYMYRILSSTSPFVAFAIDYYMTYKTYKAGSLRFNIKSILESIAKQLGHFSSVVDVFGTKAINGFIIDVVKRYNNSKMLKQIDLQSYIRNILSENIQLEGSKTKLKVFKFIKENYYLLLAKIVEFAKQFVEPQQREIYEKEFFDITLPKVEINTEVRLC